MFDQTTNLRRLFLQRNSLLILREKTFEKLKMLLELDLSNNEIASVTGSTFIGLVSLTSIKATDNPLTNKDRHCPSNKFLKRVELLFDAGASVSIYECAPTISCAVDGCSHTEDFPASTCNFDQAEASFSCENGGLAGVVYLTSIPERSVTVSFKNNLITSVKPETFRDLRTVETIDLSHNKLSSLPTEMFIHMKNLKLIILDGNEVGVYSPTSCEASGSDMKVTNESLTLPGNGNTVTWYNCIGDTSGLGDERSGMLSSSLRSGHFAHDIHIYLVFLAVTFLFI
jgi:Leucine-rich repeat (LRR) protein